MLLGHSQLQPGDEGGERLAGLPRRHAGGAAAQGEDGVEGVCGDGLHATPVRSNQDLRRGRLSPGIHAQASA